MFFVCCYFLTIKREKNTHINCTDSFCSGFFLQLLIPFSAFAPTFDNLRFFPFFLLPLKGIQYFPSTNFLDATRWVYFLLLTDAFFCLNFYCEQMSPGLDDSDYYRFVDFHLWVGSILFARNSPSPSFSVEMFFQE